MKHKAILLALTVVSAAMFALPAIASAGEWELDAKLPQAFTAVNKAGTVTTLTQQGSATKVTCTGSTGSGKYTTKTTGEELTLTFTGCKESAIGTACTTSGQASGTIKTTDLTFHNVMLEATKAAGFEKGTPGILITPNGTHFASFTCGFGLVSVEVTGNGIMGDISAPACGAAAQKTATLNFDSSATGVQKWMQITTAGTKFDLDSKENGTVRTASQDGEGTITFSENVQMTCP